MTDDFGNPVNGLSAAALGYLPPGKGSPYGQIVPLQQPATPAAVGATAMPGNLAPFQGYPASPPSQDAQLVQQAVLRRWE